MTSSCKVHTSYCLGQLICSPKEPAESPRLVTLHLFEIKPIIPEEGSELSCALREDFLEEVRLKWNLKEGAGGQGGQGKEQHSRQTDKGLRLETLQRVCMHANNLCGWEPCQMRLEWWGGLRRGPRPGYRTSGYHRAKLCGSLDFAQPGSLPPALCLE